MIDSDIRILLAGTYVFGEIDFTSARERLAQKAWGAVRASMDIGCYLTVCTFPRWSSTDGMMAFAPLKDVLDITNDTCICYQLNRSPIDDLISSDISEFSRTEIHSPKLLSFLPSLLNDVELSSLFIWIGECNHLPSVQRLKRTEACAAIREYLKGKQLDDIALFIQ